LKLWQNSNLSEQFLRNKNCIHEEIKSRLNVGKTLHHSVQSYLSSSFVFKTIKIKIYKRIILLVVLLWGETRPQAMMEKPNLRPLRIGR